MQIFAGEPWREGVKQQWVVENGDFYRYVFGPSRDKAIIIIQRYAVPRQLSIEPKIHDLGHFTLNSVICAKRNNDTPMLSAEKCFSVIVI